MLQTPIKCIFQTLLPESSVFTRFGAQLENCVLQLGAFHNHYKAHWRWILTPLYRHSVVAFVRPNLPTDIRRANFVVVLEWLKSLSGKDDMPLQEACIITLCGLATCVPSYCPKSCYLSSRFVMYSVSEDEEKNIILLRLLEYLGHPNPYVCAVAYNEVGSPDTLLSITLLFISTDMVTAYH